MTEISVKVNADFEDVIKSIIDKGFKFKEKYLNSDTYYTTFSKQELKNSDYKTILDKSILVRCINGNSGETKNIIYKKKNFDYANNVIGETKLKLNIDNIATAKNIFDNLGLTCWCDYQVSNNEYFKDDIVINIQYVNGLGTFLEIEEYPSIKQKSDNEKFNILTDIAKLFGLPLDNNYSAKKPYLVLTKNQIVN